MGRSDGDRELARLRRSFSHRSYREKVAASVNVEEAQNREGGCGRRRHAIELASASPSFDTTGSLHTQGDSSSVP